MPDLLAEEEAQLSVVAQALEVTQPQNRAHIDMRDHLGHAPSAVAVGTVQVAVADAADDVLQPGQRGVGVGGGIREHGDGVGGHVCLPGRCRGGQVSDNATGPQVGDDLIPA